jgi:hypothetical protein
MVVTRGKKGANRQLFVGRISRPSRPGGNAGMVGIRSAIAVLVGGMIEACNPRKQTNG